MGFVEQVIVRLGFAVALLALVVLAVGPARFRRGLHAAWTWIWKRRLDPEEILTQVVRAHEEHIAGLRKALARSEAAETEIVRNLTRSKENISAIEEEARQHVAKSDDLGARAALYKLNLEGLAVNSFEQQLQRQRQHITEARRRLYLLELQLRQYEVGRTILLSRLAEARTVEQQYAIAKNFDPFNAVANWQQAEGLVQEEALNARAVEQVYNDLAEMPLAGQPAPVDPAALDCQLAELKAHLGVAPQRNGHKSSL
jgi:phage shock protein A